jgi:hypothetical protein
MGDANEAVTSVQIEEMNLAVLERGIVSWTDENGAALPVTRADIERLAERDGDFILAEIRELNPRRRRTEEEQEFFRGADGGGAAES